MTYAPPPPFPPPPPLTAVGAASPVGPASEPPKPQSQLPIVIAILAVAVLGIGIGATIIRDRTHGPAHPEGWDPRALEFVEFAEQHRGLTFEHPVFVDFVDAEEYSKRTRTEQTELTDDDKQQLEDAAAQLRALGLADESLDLLAAGNDLADSGTLAFYNPETERVTVRGTDLTVDTKVTLVHELTHVLQDQHFNIKSSRFDDTSTSGERLAFRAVVEGDAVRIENEYIDSLSEKDRTAYQSASKDSVDNASNELEDVPAALQALQAAPYIYGPQLLSVIEEKDGTDAINAALETPPTTEEQLVDPRAFFGEDGAKPVEEPALPDGVTASTDSGDFGALSLFLVLGERIDPFTALDAADGWGGDAYTAFQQDGHECIRLQMVGDTDDDTRQMKDALQQWVAQMPTGAASVHDEGDGVLLQSCDAGKDSGVVVNNRALDLVSIPAAREQLMLSAMTDGGLSADEAFDYGDCVVRSLSFEQFKAANQMEELSPELEQVLAEATSSCRD